MTIEDFVCDWCGMECDGSLSFHMEVEWINNEKDIVRSCPDCISKFFTEIPDEIETMILIKDIVRD